jgi:biopolymer transport protein ExbB
MMANIVVEYFGKGGPVMWPILFAALVAVAVVGERAFWWMRESRRRDPGKLEQLLAALENSDVAAALKIAEGSEDPRVMSTPPWKARCNWPPALNWNGRAGSSP